MMLFLKIWFIVLAISFVAMFIGMILKENDCFDSKISELIGEIYCWWFPIQLLTTFIGGFLWLSINIICIIFG